MNIIDFYRDHPFRLLSAGPLDTRERLVQLQQEMALLYNPEEAGSALQKLLHEKSRLYYEIRWFPQTEEGEISKLFRFCETCPDNLEIPDPSFSSPSFLAGFNALRLRCCTLPMEDQEDLRTVLYSLSAAADALRPAQVMEELNSERQVSGFPVLSEISEVDAELTGLLIETVQYFVTQALGEHSESFQSILASSLEKEYKSRQSLYHNSYLLELAAEEIRSH